MSEKTEQQYPSELSQIYAQLKQQDVEQFYTGYQWWKIRQRIIALQAEIGTLCQQIDENAQYMQEVRPPAVALATLARLQANGVHDLELLDRMLERGEGWLDLIVQRLDYCEQLEFIHDNYTQWCEHALEGAYDWIDSMRGADVLALSAASSDIIDLVSVEATEKLLLRKLTSEEEEEEAQPLSPPVAAIEEMLPAVEEFENIAEGSLPEEIDAIASSAIAFVEEDNPEILLPDEVVAAEVEEDSLEILLPDEVVAAEQETEFQDGDLAPVLEIQLPTAANAEADLSLDIQVEEVHPQEPLQEEMEMPLVTEDQHPEQQTVEPALALDAPLPEEAETEASPSSISAEQQVVEPALVLDAALSIQVDVAPVVSDDQDPTQQIVELDSLAGNPIPMEAEAETNPTTVPIEQDSEQQAAEPALMLEGPSSFEGSVEADSVQVPIDQVASPEDTSASATQETLLPSGADSPAASDELHNEQVAEAVAVAEVSHAVETNAEVASPVEAVPEAVHTVEENTSQEAVPEAAHTVEEGISQEVASEVVHTAEESSSQEAVPEAVHTVEENSSQEAVPEAVHTAEESSSQEAVPEAVHTEEESSSQEAASEVVHTAEESSSQQDVESAPAQNVKPRGFWRWLLALFRG